MSTGPRSAGWAERLRLGLSGTSLDAVLARGAGGSFIVSLAMALVQLAQHLLLARWLGSGEYGIYVYFLTWVNVLALLVRLGLESGQVRFVAAYRVEERWALLRGLLRRSDRIVLATSASMVLLSVAALALLAGDLVPSERATGWLACVLLPLAALLGLRRGTLQGLRRVVQSRLTEALQRLLALGLIVVLVLLLDWTPDSPAAMAAMCVATGAVFVLSEIWVFRGLPAGFKEREPAYEGRTWMRVSLPLLLVSGMRLLLNQTDVLLVGLLVGRAEAGIYFVAARLAHLVSSGLVACNYMAAPLIAECHAQGRLGPLQRLATLTAWGATASSVVFAAALILGRDLVLSFFGPGFGDGTTVLVLLLAGQVVNAVTGPVGNLLNMTGFQDANARILGVVVGLNLLLNYPAILLYGTEGAAAVTGALIAVKNLWTWIEVRRRLGVNSSIFGGGLKNRVPEESSP